MGLNLEFVFGDKSDRTGSYKKIKKHFPLYEICFSDPEERETLQKLQLLFARVEGWNFVQAIYKETGEIVGVCQFVDLNADSGVLEHIYVHPDYRLKGVGRALEAEVSRYMGKNYLAAEMNDKFRMTPELLKNDDPHPDVRKLFWILLGYFMVNAFYRQAALKDWTPTQQELDEGVDPGEPGGDEEEAGTVNYLCLIVKPKNGGKTIPVKVYAKLVEDYFRTFLSKDIVVTEHPCYVDMMEKIGHLEELDLQEIGTERTLFQTSELDEI